MEEKPSNSIKQWSAIIFETKIDNIYKKIWRTNIRINIIKN